MSQMKTLAVKLPESAIKELKEIADSQYILTRTMILAWIMQRLNAEMGRTKILEVEPEDDEIEAIREGEKQFAAGECVDWKTLKAGN
jgi:predicted transcriptional regulator